MPMPTAQRKKIPDEKYNFAGKISPLIQNYKKLLKIQISAKILDWNKHLAFFEYSANVNGLLK